MDFFAPICLVIASIEQTRVFESRNDCPSRFLPHVTAQQSALFWASIAAGTCLLPLAYELLQPQQQQPPPTLPHPQQSPRPQQTSTLWPRVRARAQAQAQAQAHPLELAAAEPAHHRAMMSCRSSRIRCCCRVCSERGSR